MGEERGFFLQIARVGAALLALTLATCGDDGPAECKKPADCVGSPGADTCKVVKGHGHCVIGCLLVNGQDNCPPTYHCTGTADDGSSYCAKK